MKRRGGRASGRRRPSRSHSHPAIVAVIVVAVAAATAAIGYRLLDDPESLPLDDAALAPEVPPVRVAESRDPGGDPLADIRLPPRERWFGFSGSYFAWTGTDPTLDHGITIGRTIADAIAAGANSARIDVHWFSLFPEPGRINRAYERTVDQFVEGFEARGGRVLIYLGGTPPWASTDPGNPRAAPRTDERTLADFARYARFVARRWPNAVAIETWNEPNGTFTWAPRPDPAAYLRLHRAAARAIRDASPRLPVLLGGIAAQLHNPMFVTAQRWLKHLYSEGLDPADYDGLAFHPYPAQGEVARLESGWFARVFDDFRLGYAWRDPDAEVWITETGTSTSGPTPFDERGQAQMTLALVRKLLTMPRVRGVYLHTQYDFLRAPATSIERGYGLLESRRAEQGRPKLAFCSLRALVTDPPPFARCPPSTAR